MAGDVLESSPASLPLAPSETVARRAVVVFRTAAGDLALDAALVEEVTVLGEATPLPFLPGHVPGLVFLRGRAVPLLDLAAFLDLAGPEEGSEGEELAERLVVVAADGMTVGLVSRRVRGVFELPAADFAAPDALGAEVRKYCQAQVSYDGRLVAVLDLPVLLRAARPRSAKVS